jgi:hypothetical protein
MKKKKKNPANALGDEVAAAPSFGLLLRLSRDPWGLSVVRETYDDGAAYIRAEEDLDGLEEPTLLRIHNAAAGSALRRFPTGATAARKTWLAIAELLASPNAELRLSALQQSPASAEPAGESTGGSDAVLTLRAEIAALRRTLTAKIEQLRAMQGHTGATETATVSRTLSLLRRPGGVSKEELIRETGAKKGYVDALLGRILSAKGHRIVANQIENSRAKAYTLEPDAKHGAEASGVD